MKTLVKTYDFTPSMLLQERFISIVFCMQENNQLHELYITHFLKKCTEQKISGKIHRIYPSSSESIIDSLRYTPCSFIICLDNQYASIVLSAHTKLSLEAPLLYVDWDMPTTLPLPLPTKLFALTLPMNEFAQKLCLPIMHMRTVKKIALLYCVQDPILFAALPKITEWLSIHDYTVTSIQRMPAITSGDITTIAHHDLVLFLYKNAPEDYIRRLAIICQEQKTVFYATNPLAIFYGATCTIGPSIARIAQETLSLAEHYLNALNVAPENRTHFEIQINTDQLNSHTLDPLFLTLAERATITSPSTADKVSAYLRLEQVPLE